MDASVLQFMLQLAKGLARQFGPNCEVVVHDLDSNDPDSSIVAIENGQVTGRKVGDGPSHVVLEALHSGREDLEDHQSVALVGKPVAMMTKEDKVKAVQFLNDTGAFLITKSGDKVCKFFGISKYTLYSYIDEAKS